MKIDVNHSNINVGVDASHLSRPLTGIGRYVLEMCSALSQIDGVFLYLYSPAPVLNKLLHNLEGVIIRTKNLESSLLRHMWRETYLPLWAKQDNIEVFWGPAHRLPHFLHKDMARVVTIHDLVWKYAGNTMRPLSRFLEKYQMPAAAKSADQVVAVSHSTSNVIANEFCIDSDKLSVISLGANLLTEIALFDSLEKLGINRSYFLFVGTLEPRKNLIRLLTAYSYLPESLKGQAMLVIAGSRGWGNVDINVTIASLGLEKNVRILGYVDESTLATLYANALFLTMPSLYEGFGLPLVEAMIHGTPVLTSNNSSMPEVAGDAGLLVDALDVDSIRKGLERMITDESLRKNLGVSAKIHAAQFNWDLSAKKLVTIFEGAIDARRDKASS
jgi:glycosyltransferase involved in cell wall biosynthesis